MCGLLASPGVSGVDPLYEFCVLAVIDLSGSGWKLETLMIIFVCNSYSVSPGSHFLDTAIFPL